MQKFIDEQIKKIKEEVQDESVLLALSGGVDSSVVAALISKAIGSNLYCVFVNHGLLRKLEKETVIETFQNKYKMNLIYVDASKRFLEALEGIINPEEKRKIIGREFINVFNEEAQKLKGIKYLAQGTIYADIVESGKDKNHLVKSHHNVGGLPEDLQFKLIEPLKTLYKDEVREVGRLLGLPEEIVKRQPFPGPGIGIRMIGEITNEKIYMVSESDYILTEEFKKHGLDKKVWQYFTVLPNIKTVGVRDQKRVYEDVIIIRAVNSSDGMTAEYANISFDVLDQISKRITSEVKGVGRVCYDITSKPPATIEWE